MTSPVPIAAKLLGRVLIASVFLVAGAMKLQEVAASLSAPASASSSSSASAAPAPAATATVAYASRRLDLVLASLGAPQAVLAALRPHHAILVALVGLGEVVAGAALVGGRAPWAAPSLLALLCLVTPVAHCWWLLPPASAGLELGHAIKNAAIAGALVLEWAAVAAGAGTAAAAAAGRGMAAAGGGGRDAGGPGVGGAKDE
jgi:uncharacterized membrane protein YphA (DoxX/SURF4 family)